MSKVLLASVVMTLSVRFGACWSSPEPAHSGSWYVTGFEWAHDGNPYESEHFRVFSDAASEHARRTLAQIGEELLLVLRTEFGLTGDSLFHFPTGQTKIHMYAYKEHRPAEWGGRAYLGGLMIFSLDHPNRRYSGHTEIDRYTAVVKHELMHVVQTLLTASSDGRLVDAWFTEGIAEHVSGGTAGGRIATRAKFERLVDDYGGVNPIEMCGRSLPDDEGVLFQYYYPMFQLAVEYLLDPAGGGWVNTDVRDLYVDVLEGVPFSAAFEARFGIGLADFEAQFFELIRGYLN